MCRENHFFFSGNSFFEILEAKSDESELIWPPFWLQNESQNRKKSEAEKREAQKNKIGRFGVGLAECAVLLGRKKEGRDIFFRQDLGDRSLKNHEKWIGGCGRL